MSEASRAHALQHAATVHAGSADAAATLETAEAFHSFMAADANTAAPVKTPAKAVTKPAAKAAKPPAKGADNDAPAEGEVTKEEVGSAIEELLNNNLREKAIKLFAKYNAKSLSGVAPEDYAALKQDAEDALLNG